MATPQRAFEFFLREARPILVRDHGEALAGEILDATRAEYERVRPEVPDIGGLRNVFQPVMTINGWIVALHRSMAARGFVAKDAVRVCHEVLDGVLRRVPGWLLRGIGGFLLSPPGRWYFERQARRSQQRRHADDFVWHVERDADGGLSMVFDECAVNKWYVAQDVRELAPYCNFADVTYSRLMGMGVDASETLGLGCAQCALRFKRGRATLVPKNLEGIVAAR
ncbi:MAG: L-2-amino-thiazoline-4-carboxylic acid hydrolase [Deltaproteobacteria bacterium]|nr:L-2-amino-thiazoline-4-carboxylic acid hydrolase [Deltaproteobacteria bacterium]MBW2394473.1 L-2-amino-thiazoline-4-carboxylic acid hydrolase [Deltaproteobacteria bacterium]